MKTKYAAGVVGVLFIAVLALGYQTIQMSGHVSTSSTLANSSTVGSSSSSTSAATSQQTTQRTIQQGSPKGGFALVATDPPIVASGVTGATATYGSLAVHAAGSNNSTGWVQLNGTGTINLMSSTGFGQTIAAAQVQSGAYDMVRMGIQSASVTYDSKVYAVAVASTSITSRLQTQAQVTGSQTSEALVDLRTFVINTANSSQPQFVFSATAESTTVPTSSVTSASLQVGAQTNLQGSWWTAFKDQTSTNVTITTATLTSGSLSLQVKNGGNSSADIQTVTITPVSASGSITAQTLPSSFSGSAVFNVSGSGSVQASNSLQAAALLDGNGTQCAAGASTSISYSGSISLGLGVVGIQISGIVPGQQYLVTVMGANTYGSMVVTAR